MTKNLREPSCPVGEPGQEGYTETTKEILIRRIDSRFSADRFKFPEETFQLILLKYINSDSKLCR